MILTVIIGKINHLVFDNVLHVSVVATVDVLTAFAMQACNFLILFLTMWLSGICFSKTKLRAIDVAGTMALAYTPMLLFMVICFLPIVPVSSYDISRVVVFLLVSIPFFIWVIALMYNAYSVSCHLKGMKAVISFIGALVVAVIVSWIVAIYLLTGVFLINPAINASNSGLKENVVLVEADTLTIRQKTEKVVKAFEQNDFNAITVYFDERMKKGLPPSGVQVAWLQATMAWGKFEKAEIDNLKESAMDSYHIVTVPFIFERDKRTLQLAFNSENKISGLFIR